LLRYLADKFKIKHLWSLHYFLGVQVSSTNNGFHLCQTKYINELLHRASIATTKPLSTPLTTTPQPTTDTPFHNPTLFCRLVAGLQYHSMTRLDVASTTTRLSQYMNTPTEPHLASLECTFCYLCGTIGMGLIIWSSTSTTLQGFSYVDWGADNVDRWSTNSYVTSTTPT
ncbi:Retrovirus-related Pol polyprotein from transposon RE1, partial [Linum perenne]